MKDIVIKFRTIHDKQHHTTATLQMIISTPGWKYRVVYSCMLPYPPTIDDNRRLIEAYMNFGHATREDVHAACLLKLAELEAAEPNN